MSALDSVEPGLVVRLPTALSLPDSKRQIKPVFPMSHLDNARNVATNYENHASERLIEGVSILRRYFSVSNKERIVILSLYHNTLMSNLLNESMKK